MATHMATEAIFDKIMIFWWFLEVNKLTRNESLVVVFAVMYKHVQSWLSVDTKINMHDLQFVLPWQPIWSPRPFWTKLRFIWWFLNANRQILSRFSMIISLWCWSMKWVWYGFLCILFTCAIYLCYHGKNNGRQGNFALNMIFC
jgi:hypothetical protein